jgi:hypothetical protein
MFRRRFPPLELPKQVQGVIPAPGTLSPDRNLSCKAFAKQEAHRDSPSDTIYIAANITAWLEAVKDATDGANGLLPRTGRVR